MFEQFESVWSSLFRRPRRAARIAREQSETLSRIDQWTLPFLDAPIGTTPVHVLTSRRDWRFAAWMLASWFHFTERAWPVVIHDDGTLTDEMADALQRLFPPARIIRRREADAALAPVLLAFPFCETLRSDEPSALKLFDAAHFCPAERFFVFDSDVLFFNYPRELVNWSEDGGETCWFTEADTERSLVSAKEASDELKVEAWPRVDSGICLLHKPALDLDFLDTVLVETSILHGSLVNATRTLAMLCAARANKGGLLPRNYEVSRARTAAADAIGRHYTHEARPHFFDDGLKRVTPHLLAPADPVVAAPAASNGIKLP